MSLYDALLKVTGGTDQPVDGSKGVWLKSGTITISSAMKMVGAVVSTGQSQFVYNKGIAQSCIVEYNRPQYIYKGGIAKNTEAYGLQHVSSGGAAYDTVVYQRQYVSSGGVAYRTVLSSATGAAYPAVDVNSAAVGMFGLTVLAGASAWLQGLAVDVVASSGGHVKVYPTGVVSGITVSNAPTTNTVDNSGYISGLHLHNASALSIASAGYITDVLLTADAGGYATRLSCFHGSAGSITMSSGTICTVHSSAVVDKIDVYSSGYLNFNGGVTISQCAVHRGSIVSGLVGTVGNLIVHSGGGFTVGGGCDITQITVSGRGTITVVSTGELSNKDFTDIGINYLNGAVGSNITAGTSAAVTIRTPYVTSCTILSSGTVNVYGTVTDASALGMAANMTVYAGGAVSGAFFPLGNLLISSGGYAEDVVASGVAPASRGIINLRAGGSVNRVTCQRAENGYFNGNVTSLTLDGGVAYLRSPCVASAVNLMSGTLVVSSGASALAVTSNAGANVTVIEGGYIEYVTP